MIRANTRRSPKKTRLPKRTKSPKKEGQRGRGLVKSLVHLQQLTLVCKEGLSCTVSAQEASLSAILTTAFQHGCLTQHIPASYNIINKTVSWLQQHNGEQPPPIRYPIRSSRMSHVVDKWNATFIDQLWIDGKRDLYDLTVVAFYLEIPWLFDLACAKIASLIKGKPYGEIVEILRTDNEHNDETAPIPLSMPLSMPPSMPLSMPDFVG